MFVAITINFFLFRVLPGSAVSDLSRVPKASPQLKHALTAEFGLDKPIWQQYLIYLRELFHGNMGISFANQQPVSHLLIADLKNTIPMVTVGTVAAIVVGVATGVLSAWRRSSVADHLSTNAAIFFYAFPTQWLGLMLLIIFAGTLPAAGMENPFLFTAEPFWTHLADIAQHMILPAATLLLTAYGSYTLVVRSSMLETLGEDYVLTARAKGLPDRRVVRQARVPQRHAADGHPGRAGPRVHRRRRGPDRGDLQLAGHRAGHVRRDPAARLPDAARRLPDPDRGRDHPELRRRPALLPPRPEDLPVTLPLQDPQLAVEAEGQPSTRSGFFRTVLRERKAAVVGLSIIVFFVVLSIIAPYISPYSITEQTCAVYAPPSGCALARLRRRRHRHAQPADAGRPGLPGRRVRGHPGRDDHRRRGRPPVRATSAGAIDIVLMRITDYLLVIPDLVLMIVIADVWGASLFHVIIVIGILEWTSTARIIRAQVMSVRERVYVKRTRALGASNARIIWKHILPQVGPLLIANTVLTIAIAIYLETALAFLGLEDPTVTTWGTILENAFERTAISSGAWWAIVPAGHRHRRRHRGLLPVRPGGRGRAEPAAEGGQPVGAPVAAAPAGRQGAGRDLSLLEVEDLHVWFDLPQRGRARCTRWPG